MIQPGQNALAVTLWPRTVNRTVRDIALVAIGTLLLTISAKIQVWPGPVPITLQTFAIMAIAAAYGSRLAVLTVLAYLAEGLAGLPVFAGMATGPAYFLGPTGGFLAGFIPLAFIVGWAADRGWDRSIIRLFAAMVVADIIVFALGFAWFAWGAELSTGLVKVLNVAPGTRGAGAAFAWSRGIAPFVVGDLVKIALAACAVPAVWQLVGRQK